MAESSSRWLPIESNPEVMNKFLHKCGLPKTWAMQDVYGLDDDLLLMINQPALAMLLLFPINEKYTKFAEELQSNTKDQVIPKDLFYMKQTISNACGTVAMIHAVANNLDKITLEQGTLKNFLESCKDLSPEERAVKLEGDDAICKDHDEIAKEGQTAAPSLETNVDYHFVVFVEKDNKVYELDGRKIAPICHGDVGDNFIKAAATAIKKYMSNDPENVNFTLLALSAADF